MKNLIYFFAFFLLTLSHPIHLSVMSIEHIPSKKKIQISVRLFLDDFELINKNKFGVNLNLGKKNEIENSKEFINEYFFQHFSIKINGKTIHKKKIKLKKKEIDDIVLWLYYEINFKQKISEVEIKNSLMTDLFRDQKNMLIFTTPIQQKAITFNSKKTSENFKINK